MPPFCRLPCRPPVRGVQFHHPVPAAADGSEEVGKDYRHMSADLQVCALAGQCCSCWGRCQDSALSEAKAAASRPRAVSG